MPAEASTLIDMINTLGVNVVTLLCCFWYIKYLTDAHSKRETMWVTKDTEADLRLAESHKALAELQREGRVTNVELAQRVGLTAPPCLRRVKGLEEDGVIKGYHADLNASKLGFAITVFAMVSLKSQAENSLREFEEAMRELSEVREVHMLNGEIDFILKVVSRDLQSFQEFLTSKLTPAPNVESVKTSLTIRTAKYEPGVPL